MKDVQKIEKILEQKQHEDKIIVRYKDINVLVNRVFEIMDNAKFTELEKSITIYQLQLNFQFFMSTKWMKGKKYIHFHEVQRTDPKKPS